MSKKYVIETAFENMGIQKIMQLGIDANGRIIHWTDSIENVEELNSDYINEHFGGLQDEAYKRGYEDGKKSVEDEGLRNNINLIVTQCGYSLDEINDMIQKMRGERQ